MMTKDELQRQLLEMGKGSVVGPPRDFVDSLGARLDAMASAQHDYAPTRPAPRPRPKRAVFVPAFAVLALVVAAILVSVGGDSPAYALSDPFNVQVQLADGRVVDGTEGLRIDKGSLVIIGAGGSVRIRDRMFGEGEIVVIGERGPEVTRRIDVSPTTTRVESPTTTVRVEEPTTTAAPPTTRVPETTAAPRPTEPPPTTKVEPPPTTKTTETTRPPTTTRVIVSMELGAQRVGTSSQVALSWSAVEGAYKYVVVRTVAVGGATPGEPVYPIASPTKLVVQTTARTFTDVAETVEGVPITAARYRVVALDSSAKVIGSSRFVQVDLPR
jgi:hypothetical protein